MSLYIYIYIERESERERERERDPLKQPLCFCNKYWAQPFFWLIKDHTFNFDSKPFSTCFTNRTFWHHFILSCRHLLIESYSLQPCKSLLNKVPGLSKCPFSSVRVPKCLGCPNALRVPECLKCSSTRVLMSTWITLVVSALGKPLECPSSAQVPFEYSFSKKFLQHYWK